MAIMMVTEPFKLFMLLSTVVTIGLTVVGAGVCALWFFAVIRRLGLRLRFTAASLRVGPAIAKALLSRRHCATARISYL